MNPFVHAVIFQLSPFEISVFVIFLFLSAVTDPLFSSHDHQMISIGVKIFSMGIITTLFPGVYFSI